MSDTPTPPSLSEGREETENIQSRLRHSDDLRSEALLEGRLSDEENDAWTMLIKVAEAGLLVLAVRPDTQGLCTEFCAYCALAARLESPRA